ncbi:MAG: D-alanyl-D-alanine carboxypeptidase [Thermoanaerobaculales bacterium]|nr:D-alanyl-D-alanine carboxypeptidase [Thermoanaerobaculales bacterium]
MRLIFLALMLIPAAVAGAADPRLIYHSATDQGQEIWSSGADTLFNPASVVKVATTLLALERLGPESRYLTTFGCRGPCGVEEGRLIGDLVVAGGGDPDFHPENAWLVAHELRRLGIQSITGDLVITGSFWMGWEHGVEGREMDLERRSMLTGGRLRAALDPELWNQTLKATWEDAAPRHGWNEASPPAVRIGGSVSAEVEDREKTVQILEHRSNPLRVILRRFNTFSNNDIVRIAQPFGGPRAVQAFLRALSGGLQGRVEVATASGEKVNRMTARQVIRLLWALRDLGLRLGFEPADLFPVPGCDPGPTPRMFPRLAEGPAARTAVVKTGTLTNTDGGVAVLAGYFESKTRGPVAFCVAAPGAGGELRKWRLVEQEWLLDLMAFLGGALPYECGAALPLSDAFAQVKVIRKEPPAENDEPDHG